MKTVKYPKPFIAEDGVLRNHKGMPVCLKCHRQLHSPNSFLYPCTFYGERRSQGYFCTMRCAANFGIAYAKKLGFIGASYQTEKGHPGE